MSECTHFYSFQKNTSPYFVFQCMLFCSIKWCCLSNDVQNVIFFFSSRALLADLLNVSYQSLNNSQLLNVSPI